ncbi:MAG TPA: hypothetical protein VEJ39_02495 [Candidatus Acidoferrales bacterium]|nr:hypothetical protein [Candidatus Acidoferrales bacterium]
MKAWQTNAILKAKQMGNQTSKSDENVPLLELISGFYGMALCALEEMNESATRDADWKEVARSAQVLLDHMPAAGIKSVLTVLVFLVALDEAQADEMMCQEAVARGQYVM